MPTASLTVSLLEDSHSERDSVGRGVLRHYAGRDPMSS